jgi:hypothetical protein
MISNNSEGMALAPSIWGDLSAVALIGKQSPIVVAADGVEIASIE